MEDKEGLPVKWHKMLNSTSLIHFQQEQDKRADRATSNHWRMCCTVGKGIKRGNISNEDDKRVLIKEKERNYNGALKQADDENFHSFLPHHQKYLMQRLLL